MASKTVVRVSALAVILALGSAAYWYQTRPVSKALTSWVALQAQALRARLPLPAVRQGPVLARAEAQAAASPPWR